MKYVSLYVPFLAKEIGVPFQEEYSDYLRDDLVLLDMNSDMQEYAYFIQVLDSVFTPESLEEQWKVQRKCSPEERKAIVEQLEQTESYKSFVLESISDLGLNMSLVSLQLSFDSKQLLITFTAESRVDFRELVRILAGKFKKKIQMLHVGARDKAKLIGGHGVCGRKLCCNGFLSPIPSVTMDAAREQNIAFKGAESLSGVCGKLKCCLNYESAQYKKLKKLFPKFGSTVLLDKEKEHVVVGMDILNGKIKLKSEHTYTTLDLDEFNERTQKKKV